jgi:hypothetical protein
MPDLSHLTIGKVPSAFAEFAEKHNELVALIGSIEAASGINIKMVSGPAKKLKVPGTSTIFSKKPRGRIRIGIQSAQPTGLTASINELHFRYFNNANVLTRSYDVDNTNGSVWTDASNNSTQSVKPNGYTGVMYDPSTSIKTNYTLNETGLTLQDAINFDFFAVVRTNATTKIQLFNITGTNLLSIDAKNVTHDMSIKTIDVCVAGVSKSMLIIASDPF